MAIDEQRQGYTREVIMEYTTDGVDHWNLTRKEELVRCGECIFFMPTGEGTPFGTCRGRRKFDTGYCDEGIRR